MTRFFALTLALASLYPAFAQVPDYVPTDGLVGWWPFDGNAHDAGPNTLNGLEYDVQATNSRAGTDSSAMYFNGSSHINLGNSSLLNPDTALSLSAWFRLDAPSSTNLSTIFGRNKDNVENRYCFNFGIQTIDGFQLRFGIEDDSNGSPIIDFNTPIELTYGEWFNYSATFSQATGWMTVYLNGLEAGRLNVGPIEINQLDTPTLIGFYRPNGNHAFQGALDDIGLWNRALNSFEIAGLFLSAPATQGCTNDLACNYDSQAFLDDGSCLFSGCMDDQACNYDAAAGCDDGSCDYSCCPGPGCCGAGTTWNWTTSECDVANPSDSNFDGCVQLNDLLDLLGAYGQCSNEQPCEAVSHEGYEYATVQIDGQCWFAENLRTTTYANGDSIDAGLNDAAWGTTAAGARTTFGEGSSDVFIGNDDEVANAGTYGHLYNAHAVTDARGLCPTGWHVPTDAEWMDLELALGMPADTAMLLGLRGTDEGAQIKSTSLWADGGNGTNASGFAGLPAGIRATDGSFQSESTLAVWWSSTPYSESGQLLGRAVYSWNDQVSRGDAPTPQEGYSVRCLRD